MRFGIFILGDKPPQLSHQEVLANVLEEARWAEELGFDEIWLAEHHFSAYGTLANLPLVASAVAAQTERIRIGTACMVAPFHDPIHLAEQIAMADALSAGRFDAGFGRGYQAHEFAGFGVSMDEATARYKECVTIVEGLLTTERFSYDGDFWKIDDLTVHPRPVQQPVPIWCTVMKTPSSFEWLAETGYGAIIGNPYQVDADLATGLDLYLKSRAARDLDRATDHVWALLNAFLDPDDEVARSYPRQSVEMSIAVHRQYSNPFERGGEIPADYKAYADWFDKHDAQTYEQILDSHLTLMGSPERVIEKMGTIVDMGWQNLMLRMSRGGAMDRNRVRASMELFAREVMPAVAELEAARSDHRVDLATRIRTVLSLDPAASAIEFEDRWYPWADLGAIASGVAGTVERTGVDPGTPIGLLLRNDPAMVGAVLGTLVAGCCVVTINPHQGDDALAAEIRHLAVPVLIGTAGDWRRGGVEDAARSAGSAGVAVTIAPEAGASTIPGLDRPGRGLHRPALPGIAVEMLTSGTTGPPKRIPLSYESFERTIAAAGSHYSSDGTSGDAPRLRSGVAIVASPLVHMSGIFRTLLNVTEGRRIALLERFRVDDFVALVRRHRPKAVSLVPTALRMVLDAQVAADDLGSIQVVTSGSAALPVDVQDAFETRYGIAVLPSYGATEFAGGVAGWTLPLHREWAATKRGSVGRPQPGRELRIVDPETGDVRATGTAGRLEVRSRAGDWVRTTDIARLDDDGFLWIEGRSDDAIVRGGFKVFPDEIADVLRSHPDVLDAGVAGIDDERLGAVPVAAVELRPGADVTGGDLDAFLRERLPRYKVPTAFRIVGSLPRTPSMKVSQPALRELFVPVSER